VEDADGNTDVGFVTLSAVTCFTSGTLINTEHRARSVDSLVPGDLIKTLDHHLRPLLWVGRSHQQVQGKDAPIDFDESALGAHSATSISPLHRELITNPDAALFFGSDEVLVQACDLTNERTIRQRTGPHTVTYFHLLFDRHEIVTGDGLLSESFQPGHQITASFEAPLRSSLKRIIAARNLSEMKAARPSLGKFKAKVLITHAEVLAA